MEIKEGLNVTLKAKIEVDEATVRTCLNLLNIYGQSKGLAGVVIQFGDDGPAIAETINKKQIMDMIAAV